MHLAALARSHRAPSAILAPSTSQPLSVAGQGAGASLLQSSSLLQSKQHTAPPLRGHCAKAQQGLGGPYVGWGLSCAPLHCRAMQRALTSTGRIPEGGRGFGEPLVDYRVDVFGEVYGGHRAAARTWRREKTQGITDRGGGCSLHAACTDVGQRGCGAVGGHGTHWWSGWAVWHSACVIRGHARISALGSTALPPWCPQNAVLEPGDLSGSGADGHRMVLTPGPYSNMGWGAAGKQSPQPLPGSQSPPMEEAAARFGDTSTEVAGSPIQQKCICPQILHDSQRGTKRLFAS